MPNASEWGGVRQTQTADLQTKVLKCSNPNPNSNANPKRLVSELIRVSVRVRVRSVCLYHKSTMDVLSVITRQAMKKINICIAH